ncbi:MAG: hypothetical protein FWE15_20075 [Actinomycetia bacterium]|nr:hypothetical protein [Actinomycetes bacterium]
MITEYIGGEEIAEGMTLLADQRRRTRRLVAKEVTGVDVIGGDYSNGVLVTYADGDTETYPAESLALRVIGGERP